MADRSKPQPPVGTGGAQGTVDRVDLDEFNRDFHYNVTSMVQMARYAVPEMRKQGKGAIVNMSSVCGLTGGSPSVFYGTSKGAIVQMTRAMAGNHGAEGIRVNCVCPGMAYTPMARSRGISEDMRQERKSLGFLKYEGTAQDIGYGSLFHPSSLPSGRLVCDPRRMLTDRRNNQPLCSCAARKRDGSREPSCPLMEG